MNPHLHPESTAQTDLIATAKEEAARLHDQRAELKTTEYRLGTALHAIQEDAKLFLKAGYKNFAAFLEDLQLSKKDADWYIATRNIPAEFLLGRPIATGKLALISGAPEWLRATLCANVDTDISPKALREAIRVARTIEKRWPGATEKAIAAALRVLADHRQEYGQGERDEKTGATRKPNLRGQLVGVVQALGRLRNADEEGSEESEETLAEIAPISQELVDVLMDLGLVELEKETVIKIVPKIITRVVLVDGAGGKLKNFNSEAASPLPGAAKPPVDEKRQTSRAEEIDEQDEDDDSDDDDNKPRDNAPPPPVNDPPPAYAPWPPPKATCPEEELVKTEAAAGDQDAPPNPAALAQLLQQPTVSLNGQEYTLEQIGALFAAHYDEYHQKLLTEGLCFLMGAHGNVEWQALGKVRLRNMARYGEEEGALSPGAPAGLLNAWAERCTQDDLVARFPYVYHSLLAFRLHDYRVFIEALRCHRAQQPYRALFDEAFQRAELSLLAYWRRYVPEAHEAYRTERERLYAAGIEFMTAVDQSRATVLAERRARGLRE